MTLTLLIIRLCMAFLVYVVIAALIGNLVAIPVALFFALCAVIVAAGEMLAATLRLYAWYLRFRSSWSR